MSSLDYLDLCRLCLVKDRVSVPIFEGEGDVRQIFLKIAACLPVKVGREDKLPKKICDDCVYKVELFYQFWNTTANAEKQLLQWLGEVSMDDKQGYVTGAHDPSMMKPGQNTGENRLDGSSVMQQVNEHTNNMGMGMMDGMGIGMPMMIPNSGQQPQQQQMTSVPMDTGGNAVQNVQPVPGPSAQIGQQKINAPTNEDEDEDESEEEDNSDDECDGDDGLPVKEESEDEPNRTIEPTTFVNVSLACDEAGPSGLQQQKIGEMPEMVMPPTDGDPKSGIVRRSSRIQRKGENSVPPRIKEEEDEISGSKNDNIVEIFQVKIVHNDDSDDCSSDAGSTLLPLKDNPAELNISRGVEKDYFCYNCQIHFKTWDLMTRHTRLVHKTVECFKCLRCHEMYDKLGEFESHVMTEHGADADGVENYLERVIFYRAANGTAFGRDYKRIQEEDKSKIIVTTFETRAEFLSCNECNYRSKSKHNLAVHVARHLRSMKYTCEMCGRSYEVRRNLTYHIRFAHRGETHICDFCGKSFGSAKSLHKHRKFIHYGGKHECKICRKGLASEKNLSDHMISCHNDKPPKKYITNQHLVCHVCGNIFARPDTLRNHMKVHTGEKPFACAICKLSFAKKNSLKQHLILHTGAKPYVCDICGKEFSQKPGLTGHRKSHPGSNPPLPPTFINPIIDDLLRKCEQ